MKLQKNHVVGIVVLGLCFCLAVFGVYTLVGKARHKRPCKRCSGYSCAVSECMLVSDVGDGQLIEPDLGKAKREEPTVIQKKIELVHLHKEMDKEHYTAMANGCKKALKNCKKASGKKHNAKFARNS